MDSVENNAFTQCIVEYLMIISREFNQDQLIIMQFIVEN